MASVLTGHDWCRTYRCVDCGFTHREANETGWRRCTVSREQRRRRRQAEENRFNQYARGIEIFAPSGTEGDYLDVYPLVSRRRRIVKGHPHGVYRSEAERKGVKWQDQ